MNAKIINNLFEFWEQIGTSAHCFKKEIGFKLTMPENNSWPSKIFSLNPLTIDLKDLRNRIQNSELPNAIGVVEEENTNQILVKHHFKKTSIVKAMSLNISQLEKPTINFDNIKQIETDEEACHFAEIATKSFGYVVSPKIIKAIIKESNIKMFLGKLENEYASCGMIYLDKNGESGIHMIGTLDNFRGFGLGKTMTQKLISEAFKNNSDYVFLVASKLGEPIYTKLGFQTFGALATYTV
ncbi:GNAT family N-acetyltransferase [Aureisphaera sp. CAU 1614]|uniref:GNAT family N-acetyltransferase n=1 Tax=Halomarinibacterium sedimenti TaxID=2857106 RepID=A0A9X1FM27_9FLAO|nr:GNAT family N-acetyltransferase [Halomarinibacterium sedimenti]MBW2936758.1 GNAT family N-acetyltransferase [Halomarinibacterium sedimenti]